MTLRPRRRPFDVTASVIVRTLADRVHLVEAVGRHRPGDQEALRIPAVQRPQHVELARLLDALADRLHSEVRGHLDQTTEHRRIVLEAVDDEAAIELDDVDRERSQMLQRRVPGTEIVEGDAHTMRPQLAQRDGRRFDVADHRRLGQLEDQPRRVEAGAVERMLHVVDETWVTQLDRRHVDRDLQSVGPRIELDGATACLHQHPTTDRDDQFGLFRQWDELHRLDSTAARVLPTQQRFDTDRPTGVDLDDRLVVQDELVACQRLGQARRATPDDRSSSWRMPGWKIS